jgi:hypothetical protein
MTRNMARLYRPGRPASDTRRYDLPPERFALRVGGFHGSRVRASATDPLTGAKVPVRVRSLGGGRVSLSLPVTDSPRMVRLVEGGSRR